MKQLGALRSLALSTLQIFHLERREKYLLSLSEPSTAPLNIVSQSLTCYKVSWDPLTRETSNGEVIAYEVKHSRVNQEGASSSSAPHYQNTTDAFVTLRELIAGSTYHALVRAYTSVGAGPFSSSLEIVTTGRSGNDYVYYAREKSY